MLIVCLAFCLSRIDVSKKQIISSNNRASFFHFGRIKAFSIVAEVIIMIYDFRQILLCGIKFEWNKSEHKIKSSCKRQTASTGFLAHIGLGRNKRYWQIQQRLASSCQITCQPEGIRCVSHLSRSTPTWLSYKRIDGSTSLSLDAWGPKFSLMNKQCLLKLAWGKGW